VGCGWLVERRRDDEGAGGVDGVAGAQRDFER
jgi:hypothetical protein